MSRWSFKPLITIIVSLLLVVELLMAQGQSVISQQSEKIKGGESLDARSKRLSKLMQLVKTDTPSGLSRSKVVVELSNAEKEELLKPKHANGAPLKIGIVKSLSEPVSVTRLGSKKGSGGGVIEETDSGGLVWARTISSPDATAVRLHVTNFRLPRSAAMYVYSGKDGVSGPYTGTGPNQDGDFWTNSVFSDKVTVLVRFNHRPRAAAKRKVKFTITDLGHIGPGFLRPSTRDTWGQNRCGNASCVIDANCGNLGPAADVANAVAKMEWIRGPYIYTCTGGLVADTDSNTQRRLFLTANHCLNKSTNNLETFFNYTTISCNGTCPTNPAPNTTGATVLATGRTADYTLLELGSGSLPSSAVFLGWNASPIAFTAGANLYRVSNPNFGPQVYSHHQVDTGVGTCTGWSRGPRIYSNDISGATDGGSSGSPVVNSSGQVVGQLSGCCGYNCADVCDSSSNSTVDGALAYYYAEVATYLDPGTSGGGCTSNSECDDGLFCNGSETCSSGSCQSGSNPCSAGQTCNESTDQCGGSGCLGKGAACTESSECCSNNCKGPAGNKTCK